METKQPLTQHDKFAILAPIVAAMGGTVTRQAEPDPSASFNQAWLNFSIPEGSISLHYSVDRAGDFIHVSADWPRDAQGKMITARDAEYTATAPKCNISAAKRPDVIAAEIRRRFLPEFARLYAKAKAIAIARNDYKSAVERNKTALAEACSGTHATVNGHSWFSDLPAGVSVKYVSADRVDLQLECTVDEACAILHERATKAAKATE